MYRLLSSHLQVYLPGFLSSNLYYKYLSDLINSVRADEFVGGNTSAPANSVASDNDRSTNASEGSQAQVTDPRLTPLSCDGPLFSRSLTPKSVTFELPAPL